MNHEEDICKYTSLFPFLADPIFTAFKNDKGFILGGDEDPQGNAVPHYACQGRIIKLLADSRLQILDYIAVVSYRNLLRRNCGRPYAKDLETASFDSHKN